MLIVHIGFGKTATTSLQRKVFEHLTADGAIASYNPPDMRTPLEHFRRGDRSTIPDLQAFFATSDNMLISLEALLGWDPGTWDTRLEMNKAIFPADSTILITLRDPESYLRSVYQQTVAQGNVVPETSFFLVKEDYDRVRNVSRPNVADIFSVDELDYRHIIDAYAAHFAKVCVVPISATGQLDYLAPLGIPLTEERLSHYRREMTSGAVDNRSFSARAMAFTHWRERWLNVLGLQSRFTVLQSFPITSERVAKPRKRSLMQRIVGRLPTWRKFITRTFDRVMPYTKYTLAPNTPRGRHFDANAAIYKQIAALPAGYLLLEQGNTLASVDIPRT